MFTTVRSEPLGNQPIQAVGMGTSHAVAITGTILDLLFSLIIACI